MGIRNNFYFSGKSYRPIALIQQTVACLEKVCGVTFKLSVIKTKNSIMDAHQMMLEGIAKVNSGDINGGLQLINNAISIDSNDPEKLHARGQIHSALNNKSGAEEDYKKAIKINPYIYQYHYNLGNVYFDTRQFAKAVNSYSNAIELNPNDSDIYSNRGMCLIQESRRKEAYNDFQKALSITPHDQPAKNGLNILLSVDPYIGNSN